MVPSNFLLLERDFADIILSVRDGDSTGKFSTDRWLRKTIRFQDGSKMYITEHIVEGKIARAQYDWEFTPGQLLKFHSEPHEDEAYQTASEPFHVHPPEALKLTNRSRLPNFHHQDLFSILEMIRYYLLIGRAKAKTPSP